MQTSEELKNLVKEKYTGIARQEKKINASSCCGATTSSDEVYNIMADDYNGLGGYEPDADLGLGCGIPTRDAQIKQGDTVIDLGSGAGNDCFIARHETGETGKVIGVDMTPAMIQKARGNADKLGFKNVEFRLGDIEHLPVTAYTADVVISNCVLNLVPDKKAAFSEIYRVLKPGGHFTISDIVLTAPLPSNIKEAAELYAGCVSGAILKNDYLELIRNQGFLNVSIRKEKQIDIPDDILREYISDDDITLLRNSGHGIYSITVYGEKPRECVPGKCC